MVPGFPPSARSARTYAGSSNRRYGFDGRLGRERFFARLVADSLLRSAVRYGKRSPPQAQCVEHSEEYLWPSARGRCRLMRDPVPDSSFPPRTGSRPAASVEEPSVEDLTAGRAATRCRIPYANRSSASRNRRPLARLLPAGEGGKHHAHPCVSFARFRPASEDDVQTCPRIKTVPLVGLLHACMRIRCFTQSQVARANRDRFRCSPKKSVPDALFKSLFSMT